MSTTFEVMFCARSAEILGEVLLVTVKVLKNKNKSLGVEPLTYFPFTKAWDGMHRQTSVLRIKIPFFNTFKRFIFASPL
jgi:hypothetical protein